MQRGHQDHRPHPERRDRVLQERIHDPYKARGKMTDPAVCPRCHAVYETGRWRWRLRPITAEEIVCQACERVADHCPAGTVTFSPLNQITEIRDTDDGIEVTTTDIHLPRHLGEALRRSHRCDLTLHYDAAEYVARVRWQAV